MGFFKLFFCFVHSKYDSAGADELVILFSTPSFFGPFSRNLTATS